MSDIKRYDLVGEYDLSMEEMTEGDYVLYSDHEQQLKERDALLEECEGFISTQAEMIDNTGISDSVGYAPYQERLHKLLTKIKDRNKP